VLFRSVLLDAETSVNTSSVSDKAGKKKKKKKNK